jgi:hypothetical protein
MGLFPTSDNIITRAKSIFPIAAINPLSFWEFENPGTLGTNLTGSVVYVGSGGTVTGIIAGTTGLQGVAQSIQIIDKGTGYATSNGVNTVVLVQNSVALSPKNLTVFITATAGEITAITVEAGGIGYSVGDIITIGNDQPGGNSFRGRINNAENRLPTAGQAVVFGNVPSGTVLPVLFDYIVPSGTNPATSLVVGK